MATISELLTNLEGYLSDCYGAVNSKGGTVPTQKNASNLVTAIYSIYDDGTSVAPTPPPLNANIDETLDNLETHLAECYAAVAAKKGTVPANKNWNNLSAAILSIPNVYGYLTYVDDNSNNEHVYAITSAAEMKKLGAPSATAGQLWDLELDSVTVSNALVRSFQFTPLGGAVKVDNFLAACEGLTLVEGTEYITTIGAYFCSHCTSLDCPMSYAGSVNQSGTTARTGRGFLAGCTSFNSPITIPSGVTRIGANFLENATDFNQPLTLPSTLQSIEGVFLQGTAFNQPLAIPEGVTSIGSQFLMYCSAFDSPLTLPSTLNYIGGNFLLGCTAFNQPLTLSGSLLEIGSSFMASATKFNFSLTLPEGLQEVGYGFMTNARQFIGPLYVPTGVTFDTSHDSTLAVLKESISYPIYSVGVEVTGPGATELRAAFPNTSTGTYRRYLR